MIFIYNFFCTINKKINLYCKSKMIFEYKMNEMV